MGDQEFPSSGGEAVYNYDPQGAQEIYEEWNEAYQAAVVEEINENPHGYDISAETEENLTVRQNAWSDDYVKEHSHELAFQKQFVQDLENIKGWVVGYDQWKIDSEETPVQDARPASAIENEKKADEINYDIEAYEDRLYVEGNEGGNWEQFYDEDGRPYLYNHMTGESAWNDNSDQPTQLPEGWQLCFADDEAGTPYYYNEWTGETSWEFPAAANAEEEAPAEQEATVLEAYYTEWYECYDENGNVYYSNAETGETAWELPEGGILIEISSEQLTEYIADSVAKAELMQERERRHQKEATAKVMARHIVDAVMIMATYQDDGVDPDIDVSSDEGAIDDLANTYDVQKELAESTKPAYPAQEAYSLLNGTWDGSGDLSYSDILRGMMLKTSTRDRVLELFPVTGHLLARPKTMFYAHAALTRRKGKWGSKHDKMNDWKVFELRMNRLENDVQMARRAIAKALLEERKRKIKAAKSAMDREKLIKKLRANRMRKSSAVGTSKGSLLICVPASPSYDAPKGFYNMYQRRKLWQTVSKRKETDEKTRRKVFEDGFNKRLRDEHIRRKQWEVEVARFERLERRKRKQKNNTELQNAKRDLEERRLSTLDSVALKYKLRAKKRKTRNIALECELTPHEESVLGGNAKAAREFSADAKNDYEETMKALEKMKKARLKRFDKEVKKRRDGEVAAVAEFERVTEDMRREETERKHAFENNMDEMLYRERFLRSVEDKEYAKQSSNLAHFMSMVNTCASLPRLRTILWRRTLQSTQAGGRRSATHCVRDISRNATLVLKCFSLNEINDVNDVRAAADKFRKVTGGSMVRIRDVSFHRVRAWYQVFVLRDYCNGTSLKDLLMERVDDIADIEILSWIESIAKSLLQLSRCGLAHCGIHPSNLFLLYPQMRESEGIFDSSQIVVGAPQLHKRHVFSKTEEPVSFVPLPWMAPEGLSSFAPTPKADVWSLGAIAYTLATRRFARVEGPRQAVRHPAVRRRGKWLGIFLEAALTRDPKKRPSIEEIVDYFYYISDEVRMRVAERGENGRYATNTGHMHENYVCLSAKLHHL